MYTFKELGLVNIKRMLEDAYDRNYAIPALNFISIEQFNAIIDAMLSKRSPVILLASPNLHKQLGFQMIARIAQSGVDRIRDAGESIPLALHLDHGMTYEQCTLAVEYGFSSVMIDGSALPFDENVALTARVVEYAHRYDVTVEAELGVLSGMEEEGSRGIEHANAYTDPEMVAAFINQTNVDCLAISIGTSHGLVKMKPDSDGVLPELRFDILAEIERRVPRFPIVLHGASTIMKHYVDMINDFGGDVTDTQGIPPEQVAKAAKHAVCKVNIASDGWIAAMALTRKILHEQRRSIDCRSFTLAVRPELARLYQDKMDLLGSSRASRLPS